MIITPYDKYISPSLITSCFKGASYIEMSQIVQSKDGSIKIRIVGGKSFRKQDRDHIISGMREILGEGTKITVELVSNIERTESGKLQWIILEINPQN